MTGNHTNTEHTTVTADTKHSGNSLAHLLNKPQFNTSFNGNLNFKQIGFQNIKELLDNA